MLKQSKDITLRKEGWVGMKLQEDEGRQELKEKTTSTHLTISFSSCPLLLSFTLFSSLSHSQSESRGKERKEKRAKLATSTWRRSRVLLNSKPNACFTNGGHFVRLRRSQGRRGGVLFSQTMQVFNKAKKQATLFDWRLFRNHFLFSWGIHLTS